MLAESSGFWLRGSVFVIAELSANHNQSFDQAVKLIHAAKEAGAATLNYGIFINTVIDFIIVAVAIFLLVKGINSIRRREEAKVAPSAPPAPSAEEKLLSEIRDLLKQKTA